MNQLSKPIAEGRTAEVYAWDDHQILKLYRDWCPPHWVEQESRIAHAVVAAGIPTPAAGEIVELDGRRGILYERVHGISMLQAMNARPWTFPKYARTLAELHSRVNHLSDSGLQSFRAGLVHSIERAPHLSAALREEVLKRLSNLEDGDKVCHGDFHPGNVLMTDRGAIIIDWMTACSGNPWADVARTSLLLTIGAKNAGKQVKPAARFVIGRYHAMYLTRYLQLNPDTRNELQQWIPVIAAARLNENIPGEQDALLNMIEGK